MKPRDTPTRELLEQLQDPAFCDQMYSRLGSRIVEGVIFELVRRGLVNSVDRGWAIARASARLARP